MYRRLDKCHRESAEFKWRVRLDFPLSSRTFEKGMDDAITS